MTLKYWTSYYANELRDGIAWVIFWKVGRGWNAEAIWLNVDDTIGHDDIPIVEKALRQDSNAVMLNGYDCGHIGEDMSVVELTNGVRWHYNNHFNLLKDFLSSS